MKIKNDYKPLVLISLLMLFALAATIPGIGLLIESTKIDNFPEIEVRLSAWNAEGLPLVDLDKNNFIIRENDGAAITPDEVRVDRNAPLAVALVLDISGSMVGQPLEDAKIAAARFLDRLTPGDQAALIAFSDNVDLDPSVLNPEREIGFTSNLTPVFDMIESLEAQGGTHLYNAVQKAVSLTQDQTYGHRAILILSDGVNEPTNVGDPDGPIQYAKESNLPIYVIGLGRLIDEPYLRRLTGETGGVLRLAPRSSELAQTFDDMASLLKTQYILTYTSGITSGADSLDLSIELNEVGSQAISNFIIENIPALPTSIPTEVPTEQPTPTPVPTEEPNPTATLVPIENPTNRSMISEIFANLPLYVWFLLLSVLSLMVVFIARIVRKSPEPLGKCARCGYTMPADAGSCPQCGESRQIKILDQNR
jgi:hypothetical protein